MALANPSDTIGWADSFTYAPSQGGFGDIAAVGFRANTFTDGSEVVEFGVALDHNWEAAASQEIDIYIDTNEDGVDDYILVSADLGLLQGLEPDGRLITALFDLVHGGALLEWFVTGDLNDQVQTMTVDHYGPYGFLTQGDKKFSFVATSWDTRSGALNGVYAGSRQPQRARWHGRLLRPAARREWRALPASGQHRRCSVALPEQPGRLSVSGGRPGSEQQGRQLGSLNADHQLREVRGPKGPRISSCYLPQRPLFVYPALSGGMAWISKKSPAECFLSRGRARTSYSWSMAPNSP